MAQFKIKEKYLDMIISGDKTEELRKISDKTTVGIHEFTCIETGEVFSVEIVDITKIPDKSVLYLADALTDRITDIFQSSDWEEDLNGIYPGFDGPFVIMTIGDIAEKVDMNKSELSQNGGMKDD